MTKDLCSYILIYEQIAAQHPALVGVWLGSYPRGDAESIGLAVRQGLAGFSERATWRDLADQLERSGFRRVTDTIDEVLRIGQDVVRVVFLAGGQIRCQWLTHGPDDNARAAEKPIAVFPARPAREDN